MTSPGKLSVADIAKAAEDVRTIQKFQNESLNNGFDSSLIQVDVTPAKESKSKDWPLISFALFLIVLLFMISSSIAFDFSDKVKNIMLVLSFAVAMLVVMSAHIRFKQLAITIIVSVGLIVFILVGFGVLTPKEVITEARGFVK